MIYTKLHHHNAKIYRKLVAAPWEVLHHHLMSHSFPFWNSLRYFNLRVSSCLTGPSSVSTAGRIIHRNHLSKWLLLPIDDYSLSCVTPKHPGKCFPISSGCSLYCVFTGCSLYCYLSLSLRICLEGLGG